MSYLRHITWFLILLLSPTASFAESRPVKQESPAVCVNQYHNLDLRWIVDSSGGGSADTIYLQGAKGYRRFVDPDHDGKWSRPETISDPPACALIQDEVQRRIDWDSGLSERTGPIGTCPEFFATPVAPAGRRILRVTGIAKNLGDALADSLPPTVYEQIEPDWKNNDSVTPLRSDGLPNETLDLSVFFLPLNANDQTGIAQICGWFSNPNSERFSFCALLNIGEGAASSATVTTMNRVLFIEILTAEP